MKVDFGLNEICYFKVKAVVDCVIDEGRCDQTGEEVKKFAQTAVCMPRYVFSISLHAKDPRYAFLISLHAKVCVLIYQLPNYVEPRTINCPTLHFWC